MLNTEQGVEWRTILHTRTHDIAPTLSSMSLRSPDIINLVYFSKKLTVSRNCGDYVARKSINQHWLNTFTVLPVDLASPLSLSWMPALPRRRQTGCLWACLSFGYSYYGHGYSHRPWWTLFFIFTLVGIWDLTIPPNNIRIPTDNISGFTFPVCVPWAVTKSWPSEGGGDGLGGGAG